jgi:sensor c-di-GMP phosphodiesterase-like protein
MNLKETRVLIRLVAALAGTLGGLLAGHIAVRVLALRQAQIALDQKVDRILVQEEAGAAESREVLAEMNRTPGALCSPEDREFLRMLLYRARYLKDGGRMEGGRLDCSARLNDSDLPSAALTPDMVRHDGTKVYRNLQPFNIPGYVVVAIQLGNSFVVYNPYHEDALHKAFDPYYVTDIDISTGQAEPILGGTLPAPAAILTRDGRARVGDTMYSTRCSTRFTSCITAYESIQGVLGSDPIVHDSYVAICGMAGGFGGLLLALAYHRNRSLEQQLRRALKHDGLHVVYQPILQLNTRRVVGAEALARWNDESGRPIGPETFVAIAEQAGLMREITRFVVDRALRDLSPVLRGEREFGVSVNVTAADLTNPDFLFMIDRELSASGIAAQRLIVEITESSTANQAAAISCIQVLRQKGHRVFIDDFGKGYSSLSYLRNLAVDAIKIDKIFTRAIGTDSVTSGILPQILAMASQLGLGVVIEGVERAEEADYFSSLDLPVMAQGWFYGRPVPAEEFLRRYGGDALLLAAHARPQTEGQAD